MIQERINKLKRETEIAEQQLIENFKNISSLKVTNGLVESLKLKNLLAAQASLPLVSGIGKLVGGKSNGILSVIKSVILLRKAFSALK